MIDNVLKIADMALACLIEEGADNASCTVSLSNVKELTAECMELSQLRDVSGKAAVELRAFIGNKTAVASTGCLDKADIKKTAKTCVALAKASAGDDCHGMNSSGEIITPGAEESDFSADKLISYTKDFISEVSHDYSSVNVRRLTTSHVTGVRVYKNTFGTTILDPISHYTFGAQLLSSENKNMSSYSSDSFVFKELDKPFIEMGLIKDIIENSTRQIYTKSIGKKSVGTLVVVPSTMSTIFQFILGIFMGDSAVISGASRWRNSVGEMVADSRLSLFSDPNDSKIVSRASFTADGFVQSRQTIIENGRLETLLANLYTSNKTGLPRAKSYGSSLIAAPGIQCISDIIKSIDTGVIMYRFSGGTPQSSGDFSGLAKNSFFIKDGQIASAAGQTTISGNIADMLMNIRGISKETIADGRSVMPYIAFDGVTIS